MCIYIYVHIRKDLCPLVFFSRREVIINIPGLEARIIWSGNRNEENPFSPRRESYCYSVLRTYVRTGCPARLCQENSRSAMLAGTGTTKFIAYVLTTPSLT